MKRICFKNHIPLLVIVPLVISFGCGKGKDSPSTEGSVPPGNALSTFELEEGFQMELIAYEPLVSDPVDMEIDEFGRLYVVEMPGYPIDKSGTGRIRLLSDSNGDGVMDESTVFAEDLLLPNGILRWKKGVLVTDAPNVLYLEDIDGDGVADVRDTVLTGFSLSNPHVNVNNPVYGLDNWIHLAHLGHIGTRKYEDLFGDRGSEIVFYSRQDGPVLPKNANGHSVRFRPDKIEMEMASSRTQFGHTFDQWGRYLLTHNQNHIYHEVIGASYLDRNPDLLVSNATESISDHGNETEVFQITTHPDRQLFTPMGLTTASSGITAYLGGIFPGPFEKNAVFVAESVSNLVHVDILEEKGASFVAKRHRDNKEFLASRDSWSRPVNMYVGPDGGLYVLDYYRRIIEHPEWMSDEAVEAGGLYDGVGMGRIYRITPKGTGKADWTAGLDFGNESPKEWVTHLANPNIWWRINAQRLLIDAMDMDVIPNLVFMAKNENLPEGRLHALWTLEGMGKLESPLILESLKDAEAGIRENAIKLAELHLEKSPELGAELLKLKDDPHPRVRFQLLCTIGFMDNPQSAKVTEELLFQDLADEWVQIAALSAASSQTVPLLDTVLKRFDSSQPAYGNLVTRLTAMIAAGDELDKTMDLLNISLSPLEREETGWKAPVLIGITEGIRRKKENAKQINNHLDKILRAFFDHPQAEVRKSVLALIKVLEIEEVELVEKSMERAISIATDPSVSDDRRAEALRFLPLGDVSPFDAKLKDMIVTKEPMVIQIAAMQALGRIEGIDVPQYFLTKWETLTPEIRDVALETFLFEPERVKLLLDALESKKIPVALIGWKRRVQLMNHSDLDLRTRARDLLTKDEGEEVNRQYQEALELEGDPVAGKTVYMENCAVCHQFRGKNGVAFGPDLGTVHNWHPKDLMANILDPNLSIAPGFDLWDVRMNDGEQVQGMIMNETSAAISLRTSPGIEKSINRQEISSIRGLNMSMMPGLAGQINQQEMADLIAYIRNLE